MISEDEARRRYGPHAVVSYTDDFTLVHLDRPDEALVRLRTQEFDAKDYFEEACPLCALQKRSRNMGEHPNTPRCIKSL